MTFVPLVGSASLMYMSVAFQPKGNGSWVNDSEVDFILLLYQKLVDSSPVLKSSSRLAMISPYREQIKKLRERFKEVFGIESEKLVDVNTVDGFQGQEKDVVIFSCVRACKTANIRFLDEQRHMNVTITRAKSSILVVVLH